MSYAFFGGYDNKDASKSIFKDGFINRCDYIFTDEQNKRMRLAYEYWFSGKLINCNPQSKISLSNDIDFPATQINTNSTTQTLTISNIGDASFNVTDITSSNNAFTIINGQSTSILQNEELEIQIRFRPTQARSYTGTISVRNDADNENNSNSSISVRGRGTEEEVEATSEITLSVSSLAFADTEVNTTSEKTFRISNTGDASFAVSGISVPSSRYTTNWTRGTIAAGAYKDVTISFRPTSATDYNGTININHNADNGNGSSSISVRGRGTEEEVATSSVISLTGNNLNFGDVEVGDLQTGSLTVSNTGTANFDVQSFNLPTGYSASPTSARITAGTSRNFTITFRPTSAINYSGFITVISNANSGNGAISVSGRGVNISQANVVNTFEYMIDDDNSGGSNGNDNGIIEAGEEIELRIKLRNNGAATATNVRAIISIRNNPSCISITDDEVDYGTISAGSTNWGTSSQDFDLNIASNCRGTVTFTLRIISTSNGNTTLVDTDFTLDVEESSSSSNYSDISVESITFDNDGDGQYDIDVDIRNVGNTATPSGEDMTIRYYVNGTYIGDDRNDNMNPNELDTESFNNHQFTSNGNHTIRVDISQMSNEIVTSNNTKTVNLNVTGVSGGGGGSSTMTIEASNNCSTSNEMQMNTEYEATISSSEYSSYGMALPIDARSSGGNNVRGFWFRVRINRGSVARKIKVYDVSDSFNPVIGVKLNCVSTTPYLNNAYADSNGDGRSETYTLPDGLVPSGSNSYGIFYVRIYHYDGGETPYINFKIKVEE